MSDESKAIDETSFRTFPSVSILIIVNFLGYSVCDLLEVPLCVLSHNGVEGQPSGGACQQADQQRADQIGWRPAWDGETA